MASELDRPLDRIEVLEREWQYERRRADEAERLVIALLVANRSSITISEDVRREVSLEDKWAWLRADSPDPLRFEQTWRAVLRSEVEANTRGEA